MNAKRIAQHVTKEDDGYSFFVDVSNMGLTCAGVQVQSIGMWVAEDEDEGSGDLAVNWSMDGLQNNADAQTAGMLLLRNLHSNDDVTKVMSAFYWKHEFDAKLRKLLVSLGFSKEAASDVGGSEWGMQDEGRASYDAYAIADEVRNAMAE